MLFNQFSFAMWAETSMRATCQKDINVLNLPYLKGPGFSEQNGGFLFLNVTAEIV